ncbi:hypothetical protein Vafri_21383, partial [Volvox africanus]
VRVRSRYRGKVVHTGVRALILCVFVYVWLTGTEGEDREAYRNPDSKEAWHAAAVMQANIDRSAATGVQRQREEQHGQQREEQTSKEGMPRSRAGAGGDGGGGDGGGGDGAVRGAAESVLKAGRGTGEGARGAMGQAAGTWRGAAAVAGQEVDRAVGVASGAAEVAGEEA